MNTLTDVQREKVTNDLKNVIHDAEELLKQSAGEASAEATAMRERIRMRLMEAKDSLLQLQATAVERAKFAGRKADDFVHEHPWQAVGIAAGVGVVAGLLTGRR